jgi:hypothetical protein
MESVSASLLPVSDSPAPDCAPCLDCDYWRTIALALLERQLTRVPGFNQDERAGILERLAAMAPERAA